MSEIEKQFFEAFGINKSTLCKYAIYGYEGEQETWYKCTKRDEECWTYPNKSACEDRETAYPEITEHILLELIRLSGIYLWGIHPKTVNGLKNVLLKKYIEHVDLMADENEKQEHIHQVQELFKENNQ